MYQQQTQLNNYFSHEPVTVNVIKLLIQKSNTYNQMYNRPYESNLQHDDLKTIMERLSRNPRTNITPNVVSDVASNIIRPSSIPVGLINIPNGWDTPRDRFLLIAEVAYNSGSTEKHFIQGYTDYHCVSEMSNSIDPASIFTINSINKMNVTQGHYVNGVQTPEIRRLTASDQIITKTDINSNTISMRPVDVINTIETETMNTGLRQANEEVVAHDTRTSLKTMGPSSSKRYNNVPSVYLSNLMNGYNSVVNEIDELSGDADIWRECSLNLNENLITGNAVVRYLSRTCNVGFTNWFRYSDLISAFPYIDNVTTYIRNTNTEYSFIHTAGSTETLNQSTREGVAAAMLSQSVPAIMTQCMLNSIRFRTTNNDALGNITTVIIAVDSLAINPTAMIEAFKSRFQKEVYNTITYNNSEVVELDMSCDLFGDTCINISIAGGPMIPYVYPTFCDSLLAPTITNNPDSLRNISGDMETLLRQCGSIIKGDDSMGGALSFSEQLYGNPFNSFNNTNFNNTNFNNTW